MNKLFRPLILAALCLTSAVTAHAVNEFAKPMIYPPFHFNSSSKCQLVRLEATAIREGQTYAQTGIGWVIKGDEGWRVLTPAHVISGADQLTATCLNKSYRLRLLGKTETKDLALLAIDESAASALAPLIDLKSKRMFEMTTVDHFKMPFEKLLQYQIYNNYIVPEEVPGKGPIVFRSFEKDIKSIGIAHFEKGINSLVAETLAIRPGYSGAPLMIEIATDYNSAGAQPGYLYLGNISTVAFVAGMLNKVEINGSRSLGVSLPEILEILPALWKSQSTSRDVYVDLKKSKASLRYQNTVVDGELQRTQELVVKNEDGTEAIYSEMCLDQTQESSSWVTAKERKKAITQSSKGGDYGEGGGSSVTLKNSVLMTPTIESIFSLAQGNLTSYKKIGSCDQVLLKDNKGRFYDSFIVNGQAYKTTNLSDLYNALTGAQASKNSNKSMCRPYRLDLNDGVMSFYNGKKRGYTYYRGENLAVPDSSQVNSPLVDDYTGFVRCYKGTELNEVYYKNLTYIFYGIFGDPKKVSGFVQFSGPKNLCSLEMNENNYKRVNRWKHQIRSKNMDIDVNIGTEGRILGIKFLKLSSECMVTYHQPGTRDFWFGEENFSTPEAIKNSAAPNSFIYRKAAQ